MYGFFCSALEEFIVEKHGRDAWIKILRKSHVKLHGGSFLLHKQYPDDLLLKLVQSAADTIGLSPDDVLEELGSHFLSYCLARGYDKMLRVLGSNLSDFLSNLDNLHDHVTVSYCNMKAPSFRVTPGPNGSIHLHYYSTRKGLQGIVRGLVKTVARDLFETDVSIGICRVLEQAGERYHFLMEISDNSLLKVNMLQVATPDGVRRGSGGSSCGNRSKRSSFASAHITDHLSKQPQDLCISTRTLCTALPFHALFDRDLIILEVGDALRAMIRNSVWTSSSLGGPASVKLTDVFRIARPVLEVSFDAILDYLNQAFVLLLRNDAANVRANVVGNDAMSNLNESVRFKGQMISVPESDTLLFVGSPRFTEIEDMARTGVYFSDFPVHDASKDLVLLSHYQKGERELVEKLDEASNHLKVLEARLRDDKKKTEDLICSIFPAKVAHCLLKDLPVEAEQFPMISCLFSDIVGFTALCSNENVVPMDIIRLLNRLYVQFDALTNIHQVYKVETIGDAYMVVSSVPEPMADHADRLVMLGLEMVTISRKVQSPVPGHKLEIRVGIHSGPAMAGIVGAHMPRYCLFGHTVTLANRIEARSLPSHVNVSAVTKELLMDQQRYFFLRNTNCNDLDVICYFVTCTSSCRWNAEDEQLPVSLNTGGGHFRSPSNSPPAAASPHSTSSSLSDSPLEVQLEEIENVSRQGSIRQIFCARKKFDLPSVSDIIGSNNERRHAQAEIDELRNNPRASPLRLTEACQSSNPDLLKIVPCIISIETVPSRQGSLEGEFDPVSSPTAGSLLSDMRDERPLLATPFDGNGCRRERGGGDKNVLPHILATEAATASQGSSAMRELGPVLEASLLAPGPGPMMSRDLPKKLPSSDQLSALACADPAVPVGGAKIKPVRTKSCYAFGSKSGGAGGSGGPEEGSDRSNVGGGNLFHNIKERLLDRSALLAKLFRR
ncbi:guanylate cyclase soluble subunit beta-1-like isoform X3 [Varroa jacobsoni]|uniref:guanylate cyclase n=1 Tax=Varroa destructor TaxID=109461 RepID=A0A7M7KZY9_VARDE|nr:guanylate cyclase soluble subunit beta-1-like isoform X1 [Varroa destructor]XP_022687413.1 guanylate cyclase soluble subunit beta-1-like isoform X3 [Varroa jacobsoni]